MPACTKKRQLRNPSSRNRKRAVPLSPVVSWSGGRTAGVDMFLCKRTVPGSETVANRSVRERAIGYRFDKW